ncbi:hypothetical protein [Streptomyces wuyuanensis]
MSCRLQLPGVIGELGPQSLVLDLVVFPLLVDHSYQVSQPLR